MIGADSRVAQFIGSGEAVPLELGATIVSFDRDFGRFAGLRLEVP